MTAGEKGAANRLRHTLPPMSVQKPAVPLEAIPVHCVRCIDRVKEHIVEKGLKSRDRVPVIC